MATFNNIAVGVGVSFPSSPVLTTWPSVLQFGALQLVTSPIATVWYPEAEPLQSIGDSLFIVTLAGDEPQFQYGDGYVAGELFGYSSQREEDMEPVQLGETDDAKKTVSFRIWTTLGLPASGLAGEGSVCVPAVGEIQVNRDLTGYVNAGGAFSHIGDGLYRYTFPDSEVSSGGGEGNTWLRVKVSGYRTVAFRVPIRQLPPTASDIVTAVLDAARSGHVGTGTIGEGIAIASSLLQGNYYMDQTTNTANGQTAARLRCFHTGAATQAATQGGSGEGEFATFLVTTVYSGPNKITEHRVVQQ